MFIVFPLIVVVEVGIDVAVEFSWGYKKTRGRAVVGDPLAFLTVVMKNYYETIISVFKSLVFGL